MVTSVMTFGHGDIGDDILVVTLVMTFGGVRIQKTNIDEWEGGG